MRPDFCKNCKNVYYDYFCSYKARYCKIHGCIDCNPDSYLNTLKKDEECPDFTIFEELKKKKNNIIDLKTINKLVEDSMEIFNHANK